MAKIKIVTNEKIKAGDVIVGLAGFGQANYEKSYNSGFASNGLTSARHDMLHKYGARFPESYDNSMDESVVYIGPHRITDEVMDGERSTTIGKLVIKSNKNFCTTDERIAGKSF